jgi:signal transduction histidine kinase
VGNPTALPPPASLGTGWHTTTFRGLFAYAAMFAVSLAILVLYIDISSRHRTDRDADIVIHWELIYFDSVPDALLERAVSKRLEYEHERLYTNFYGLFTRDGRYVGGDIRNLPKDIPTDMAGQTLNHTLQLRDTPNAPIVRAVIERRKDGMQLVIARNLTHDNRMREATVSAMIGGGLIVLATGVIGGLLLSMRQMRRVRAIRRVISRIASGDLHHRLPLGGRDELDLLVHLVNHMLDEVERLMGEVKSACDGIAHDLRTPLAHVRSLLVRVASQRGTSGDTHAAALVMEARAETDLLLGRFSAMLRISEIGASQRRGCFACVHLETLVDEVAGLFEPLAESRNIQWVVRTAPVAAIHADRALLFEAFSNLLDNAIKFAPEGGQVRIELSNCGSGPRLDIYDNGPGIPVGEREAVLKRFYRGDQARRLPGSGLGLSIVSAVLRVHDFTLRIGDACPGARLTVECWSRSLV